MRSYALVFLFLCHLYSKSESKSIFFVSTDIAIFAAVDPGQSLWAIWGFVKYGVRFFTIVGPNEEKLEFSERLKS
jgi:hypothetical protein